MAECFYHGSRVSKYLFGRQNDDPTNKGYSWVKTDMGLRGAVTLSAQLEMPGLMDMLISEDESVIGMVKRIDEATKETHGGKNVRYDGSNPPL